jgi:hypothetical protein
MISRIELILRLGENSNLLTTIIIQPLSHIAQPAGALTEARGFEKGQYQLQLGPAFRL